MKKILIEGVFDADVSQNVRIFCTEVASKEEAMEIIAGYGDSDFEGETSDPEPGYLLLTINSDGTISTDGIYPPN